MSQGRRLIELTVTFGLLVGIAGCTNHLAKSNQTVQTSGEDSSFTSPMAATSPMASPHVLRAGDSASPVMGSSEAPPVVYGMASAQSRVPDPASLSGDDYTITREDVLHVAIFQVPDLNRTVRVDGGGFVSLPLINRVSLRGMTITQAQEEITRRYSRSYLQSPQVTVSLLKSGQRVTVSGAVQGPKVLSLEGSLTLTEAIAQSGGLSELGNPRRVHVARTTGQTVEDSIYDLNEIQSGKAPNPLLRGGDIVVVEDATTKLALKTVKDILPLAVLGAFVSDARLKRDITSVAKRENGLRLYRYRYAWSDTLYVGVLAQEVLEVAPHAVLRGADGNLRVDYGRLGLRLHRWEDWIALNPQGAALN